MKTEYDVSNEAWELYRLIYKNNLPIGYQIIENGRRHIEVTFKNDTRISKNKLYFSGDTDINLTKGFAHSRLECYRNLILKSKVNKEQKQLLLNNLTILEDLVYSVVNISLILQNGNLQAVKQGIGNDRIDTFIWALHEYYNGNSFLLFNHSAYGALGYLKEYLGLFDNEYDYCKVMYHINESLVKDMVESGKQAIDSFERITKYMSLIIEFWKQKYNFLYDLAVIKNVIFLQNELKIIKKKLEQIVEYRDI